MNIDNYMNDLVSKYSDEEIKTALTKARKNVETRKRNEKIADARAKALTAIDNWHKAVFGEFNDELIREFEKEFIDAERKAEVVDTKKPVEKSEKSDDEKLREFIDKLLEF